MVLLLLPGDHMYKKGYRLIDIAAIHCTLLKLINYNLGSYLTKDLGRIAVSLFTSPYFYLLHLLIVTICFISKLLDLKCLINNPLIYFIGVLALMLCIPYFSIKGKKIYGKYFN